MELKLSPLSLFILHALQILSQRWYIKFLAIILLYNQYKFPIANSFLYAMCTSVILYFIYENTNIFGRLNSEKYVKKMGMASYTTEQLSLLQSRFTSVASNIWPGKPFSLL